MISPVPLGKRQIAYPIVVVVLAVMYFAVGRFGLQFAILDENVTLVWGASAIALAAFLLGGIRLWPAVALGAFFVNFATGLPLLSVVLIAFGNTLGPSVAAYLLRHVLPFKITFDRIQDVIAFALAGVLVTSLIVAIVGTLALIVGQSLVGSSVESIWLEWFMGDSIGILVLTPLILLWWSDHHLTQNPRRWLEFTVLGVCILVVSFFIFQPGAYHVDDYPLTYLTIPFTLWAAFRFGGRGASSACVMIALVALAGVAQRFAVIPYADVHQDLIYLWAFIALVTTSTLVVATIVSDRRRIQKELARERDYIAQVVNAMRHGVAVTDLDGRFEYVNPAYADMLGFAPDDLIGKIPTAVLPPDERAIVSNTALRMGADLSTSYETRFQQPSGEPLEVLINGSLRRDEGRATGIITSVTDLTPQKKAEAALRRSEALLKTIVSNVPFDLWVMDVDGCCIFQTPQSIQMWGNVLGKRVEEMDSPAETRAGWAVINERAAQGEIVTGDVSYMIQGEKRHFYSITSPIHDNHTSFGIMGINVDITERVQAQEALRKSEEESRLFLDSLKTLQEATIELARIDDFDDFCYQAIALGRSRLGYERIGLWLVDLDDPNYSIGTFGTSEDGTIRDERGTRAPTVDILPQVTNILEIANTKINYDPDGPLMDDRLQVVGHGWSAMGYLFDGEQVIGGLATDNYFSHKPAKNYQLELLALFSNMLGHLCILKRAEAKLQASEVRFRSIFTGVNVGIALADDKGHMVSVNPGFQRFLGYSQEEFLQMSIGDITHPDDLTGSWSLFEELMAGKREFYQAEKRYRRKDGTYVWAHIDVTLFPGEGIARSISVVEDISARKKVEAEIQQINANLEQRVAERTMELQIANERLTELDRLKTKFISDVTHELRTPLTVLNTRVYLLERSAPEKHPTHLTALKEQIERLTHFVNAMLDLSRLELGRDRIAFSAVDLNNVVQQVVMALEPRAEIAGLSMTFQAGQLPEIRGEFNQLAQVVTNLVANAINYTPNGSITVKTSLDDEEQQVCLEVTDTGMGISEADIPHLFTRFYRGEKAGQSSIPGTGLGLSIVKEIVDLHGGQITVESQVGRGTTFKVYLPVVQE